VARDSLHANRAAGVHGVPALELGGRLFWADDQLEIAAANA
jgi:2-hydroxychromene-2-carboxylate isomerase